MKDVGLRIRVQRTLRDEFIETCRAQDKPAAQVIREFMRRYVAANKPILHDKLGSNLALSPSVSRDKEKLDDKNE